MEKFALRLVLLVIVWLSLNNPGFGQENKNIEPAVKNISFDKNSGIILYEVIVPAYIRVTIAVDDGPVYRTIIDWEKQGAGKYKQTWDGLDPSGKFKLTARDDIGIALHWFTDQKGEYQDISLTEINSVNENLIGHSPAKLEIGRMHKNHPREFCHEPKIKLCLPKKIRKTKDNFYIIKDKTPIEISIEQRDRRWFIQERYSVNIFIDDVFVQGELEGYSPYTWIFDPQGLNQGKHLIVVNLGGFADHYGIASLPVYIKK